MDHTKHAETVQEELRALFEPLSGNAKNSTAHRAPRPSEPSSRPPPIKRESDLL